MDIIERSLEQAQWTNANAGRSVLYGWNDAHIVPSEKIMRISTKEERNLYTSLAYTWITGELGTHKASDFIMAGILYMSDRSKLFGAYFGENGILFKFPGFHVHEEQRKELQVSWEDYKLTGSDLNTPVITQTAREGSSTAPPLQINPEIEKKNTSQINVESFTKALNAMLVQEDTTSVSQLLRFACLNLNMVRACIKDENQLFRYFHAKLNSTFANLFPR